MCKFLNKIGRLMCIFIFPTAPPVMFNLSPSDVRVLDVVPYNNYTLTCNATLPSNLLLNISFLWFEGAKDLLHTGPSDTISIQDFPPRQIGNEVLYSSEINILEANARLIRRGCQGQVQILQTNRIVSNVTSYSNITIQGQNIYRTYSMCNDKFKALVPNRFEIVHISVIEVDYKHMHAGCCSH